MFAYCRNNPVSRKDISGTEDVSVEDFNEDSNPLNDLGNPSGRGGGSGGPVKRIGGGHGNEVHKGRIDDHMNNLEQTGEYKAIYGNRSLKTAGLVGNQRPDVIAVRSNGQIEVWEFASPTQAIGAPGYYTLQAKIDIMQSANPSVTFYPIVHW